MSEVSFYPTPCIPVRDEIFETIHPSATETGNKRFFLAGWENINRFIPFFPSNWSNFFLLSSSNLLRIRRTVFEGPCPFNKLTFTTSYKSYINPYCCIIIERQKKVTLLFGCLNSEVVNCKDRKVNSKTPRYDLPSFSISQYLGAPFLKTPPHGTQDKSSLKTYILLFFFF